MKEERKWLPKWWLFFFWSLVKENGFEKEKEISFFFLHYEGMKKGKEGGEREKRREKKRGNKISYSKNRGERKKAYQSYFCSTFDKPFHSYSKEKKFLDGVFFVVNILLSCDCFCVDFLIYTMTKPILRGVLWRFI